MVLLAVSAALFAACGQDDEASAGGETLQDFLGFGTDDPDALEAQMDEQQRRMEEAIADCMAEQGFEYIPREPISAQGLYPREGMSEEEFRQEYGFGISTIDHQELASAMDPAERDPNHEILQNMDEAERQAYQEALHGQFPETPTDVQGEISMEWEPGGCQAQAQEAVIGAVQRIGQELGDELTDLFERVQADPRIVAAHEGWAACMRDAGWDFDERHDAFMDIQERMNELRQEAAASTPLPDIQPGDELSPDFEPPPLLEPDPQALAQLQERELEVAHADWECGVEYFGENYELYQDVQAEYEAEFIEQHRDTLERLSDD